MPVWRRGTPLAIASAFAVIATACAPADEIVDSSKGDSSALGSLPAAPATSCSLSDQRLPTATDLPGITFALRTDPTRTSLLMKNTGELTAIVIPAGEGTTRLETAPYANPEDAASTLALEAIVKSGVSTQLPGMPAGVPLDQVFVVPPGWAVCALTDQLGVPPRTQYLRDKVSSAKYFAAQQLASQLIISRVTPQRVKTSRALVSCVEGSASMLETYQDQQHLDLYSSIIGTGTNCRAAYKGLLGNDEQAASKVESRAMQWLAKSPKLLKTTKFVVAIAHR